MDFLIIGQGLAGSALAVALIDVGASVLVVDGEDANSASKVAAGLITTVAGMGMNLSWRQGEYLPEALGYYQRLEALSGKQLFHPMDTLRLFDGEKQRVKFERKKELLEGWVEDAVDEDLGQWNADDGGFVMKGGGWLDTRLYLEVIREILGGRYRCDTFLEADLLFGGGVVRWKDIEAKRVVLCQGARGLSEDGLFSYLEHRSAKGEILTICMPDASEEKIVNRNGWLIPLGGGRFKVGATYEWSDMGGSATEEGRAVVEGKIRNLTDMPYEVVEHTAGVRPILRKSQPYIGHHPDHPEVSFFNGLGSKGVTTAPSVAAHFAQHLVNGLELDPELLL